jgi:pimeloyl-ACP methyl ester carboxylesterase
MRSVAVALLFLATVPAAAARRPPAATVPRFEPCPCPVEVAKNEKIDCGRLVVPENRARANGRTISIPVTIFRSRSASPRPDPVLFMTGGPGTSSVAGARSGRRLLLLDERDYVVLGQRGSRFAEPFLACPEVTAANHAALARGSNDPASRAAEVAAARACRERLVREGVDLDAYTTAETAADVEDLRRALGVEQWNLYGISYSVRIMLDVMRDYPGTVRSAVLDSALANDVGYDEVGVTNVARSLEVLFGACAADAACSGAYPDLRRQFFATVRRLNERPATLEVTRDGRKLVVVVDGPRFVDAIGDALASPQQIPLVPRAIAEAHAGRLDAFAELARDGFGSEFVWGLRYSVWCADELPFEDAEKIARQSSSDHPELGGYRSVAATPELCREWNVRPSDARENAPVTSAVPTLVVAGEYDPATPPSWGLRAVRTLANGRLVEVPGHGHIPSILSTGPCTRDLVAAFVRDPRAPLDTSCLSSHARVRFVVDK